MRKLIIVLITFLFLSATNSFAQNLTLTPEQKTLIIERVGQLNEILKSQENGQNFELKYNPLKLQFNKSQECYIDIDLSNRIYVLSEELWSINKWVFYVDFKGQNTSRTDFHNSCTKSNLYEHSFSFEEKRIAKLFKKCATDLFEIMYNESYNFEKPTKIYMEDLEWFVREKNEEQQRRADAAERRKVNFFEVTDENRKQLAYEQIERINKLIKEKSNSRNHHYTLNYELLLLTEHYYVKYKGDLKDAIYLRSDMSTYSVKNASSRYYAGITSLFSYSSTGFVFVAQDLATELESRYKELLQILFGITEKDHKPGVDWATLNNHPQLKYLGKSINDPLVQELYNSKKTKVVLSTDDNLWSNSYKRSYILVVDESSETIREVRFLLESEDKSRRYEYFDQLPYPVRGVEVKKSTNEVARLDCVIYSIDEKEREILEEKSFEQYMLAELERRKNSGEKYLITKQEDLQRYADPKGNDIWRLAGSKDELLTKYLFNKYKENNSYITSADFNDTDELPLSNKNYLLSTKYGYKYIIDIYAAGHGKENYLKERFPLDCELTFDLSTFLPLVFIQPEFVSARYTSIEKRGSSNKKLGTYFYLVEIKLKTDYGDCYIIIKKDVDEYSRFNKLTISGFKFGGTYVDTEFKHISLYNNPWVKHLETIVKVEPEKLKTYHAAIEKLFYHMENDFKTVPFSSKPFESNETRDVYLMPDFSIPNTILYSLVLNKQEANVYSANMKGDQIKDEIYTALTYLPKNSAYNTSPGEDEGYFGRCLLVKKGSEIIGMLKFKFTDEGWLMKAIAYNQNEFEQSLAKVIRQYSVDKFSSWKGDFLFDGDQSLYYLNNAKISYFTLIEKETVFISMYEGNDGFILESLLANIGKSIDGNIYVKENFRKTEDDGFDRIIKVRWAGREYLIKLSPDHGNDHFLIIECGNNYQEVTQENYEPLSLNRYCEGYLESVLVDGRELIWSKQESNGFVHSIPTSRWGHTPEVIFEEGYYYTLVVIYHKTDNRPEVGLTFVTPNKSEYFEADDFFDEDENFSTTTYYFESLKNELGTTNILMLGKFEDSDKNSKMNAYLFRKKK